MSNRASSTSRIADTVLGTAIFLTELQKNTSQLQRSIKLLTFLEKQRFGFGVVSIILLYLMC